MIELDLVLVDYSLRSDNGGSFFSSVVGFFFFGPSNSLFATFCCCMAFRRKMAKSWQPPKNMWLVMSASLRHPIDLSASLYGTDSYSAREKKKKTSTPARETEALPYVLKKKKKKHLQIHYSLSRHQKQFDILMCFYNLDPLIIFPDSTGLLCFEYFVFPFCV